MLRQLAIEFDDRDAFAREYQRNLANGGLFVPTGDAFELRELVEVAMDLGFCGRCVTLQAEVVSRVSPDLQAAGARPGVAVQFMMPAHELRQLLGGIAGLEQPARHPAPPPGREGRPRPAERSRASLRVRLRWRKRTQSGRSRNLSRTGVLFSFEEHRVPVGERVDLTLAHPTSGEELELPGAIARHVESGGRVVALAVQFDVEPERQEQVERTLEDFRSAAHAHQLGGIRGPVAALGLPNLLQMFGSASDSGTLSIACNEEEGRVVFEGGSLRHAAVGPVVGMKALGRMVGWEDGEFWFQPATAEDEPQSVGTAIYGVILEAVTQLDELKRLDLSELAAETRVQSTATKVPTLPGDEDWHKIAPRLVELAARGSTVGTLLDAFAEHDVVVYRALRGLLERGALELS